MFPVWWSISHAWAGWVSEITNGLIAAARGAFTSWRSISLNSIVNCHETSCDMCGIEIHIHSFIHSEKTQLIDLAPNVWLHSSIGRASQNRYRGGHGFESRWSPDFFRLLLSICLSWKFTGMIILYFQLQPRYRYEWFHIYYTSSL